MAREVAAPDGRSWRVKRHWIARAPLWLGPKFRNRRRPHAEGGAVVDWVESSAFVGDSLPRPVLIGISAVAAAFLAIPLLILVLDAVLIGFIALAVLGFRVALRRPWLIVAETPGPPAEQRKWNIPGWRPSARAIDEIASSITAGYPPSPSRLETL